MIRYQIDGQDTSEGQAQQFMVEQMRVCSMCNASMQWAIERMQEALKEQRSAGIELVCPQCGSHLTASITYEWGFILVLQRVWKWILNQTTNGRMP